MRKHLTATPHRPVLLHGPVGVGKTVGIRLVLEAMGYRVCVFDAVEADDTAQLEEWVTTTRALRYTQPAVKKSAIVLDDLEGFTPDARTRIARLCERSKEGDAPLILVCHAARDTAWKALRHLPDVRLRVPSEATLYRWFVHHARLVGPDGSERRCTSGAVHAQRDLLRTGDVRRVRMALEHPVHPGDAHFASPFDAARKLYQSDTTPQRWANAAAAYDVELVQFHATTHARDMDELACCLDAFSCADTLLPDRFETATHQFPLVFHCAALAPKLLTNRLRDAGPLHPPPRGNQPRSDAKTPSSALSRP